MPFYTDVGPVKGVLISRDVHGAIGVYAELGGHEMPVGMALCRNSGNHPARFRLIIGGHTLDGEFNLVNREFMPIAEAKEKAGRLWREGPAE